MNRRQKLLLSFMVMLNIAIGWGCARAELPLGSVLITRNLNEAENTSPLSFWNHLSIYVGGGYVVEAQQGQGVIATPLYDFLRRPYCAGVLYPRDKSIGVRAAAIARTQIGRPYRRMASVAPLLVPPIIPTILHGTPDGENCVSQVRECFEGAIGRPLIGFMRPDDIMYRPDLFTNRL